MAWNLNIEFIYSRRVKLDTHVDSYFHEMSVTCAGPDGGHGIRTPHPPEKSQKHRIPWNIAELPSQHSMLGYHRHASETLFNSHNSSQMIFLWILFGVDFVFPLIMAALIMVGWRLVRLLGEGRNQDRALTENYFLYFSPKTYVMGTQKNRLHCLLLLSLCLLLLLLLLLLLKYRHLPTYTRTGVARCKSYLQWI